MRDRLAESVEQIVADVESRSQDLEIERELLSNVAHDMAIQDPELEELCELLEQIDRLEERTLEDRDMDRVRAPLFSAGEEIRDALDARREELIEESISQARRVTLEESDHVPESEGRA